MGFDLWDLSRGNVVKMKWLLEDLRGPRDLVVHYLFYRICQFTMALFTFITSTLTLTQVAQHLHTHPGSTAPSHSPK